jgi:DNA-binding beta-propeller fold protein YncE
MSLNGFRLTRQTAIPFCAAAFCIQSCGSSADEPADDRARSGDIVTWAGTGTQGHNGANRHRLQSWLNQPMEIVFASDGTALILDWNNHALRRVNEDEILVNVVGLDFPGDWPCQVPGDSHHCEMPLSGAMGASQLALNHPMDVAFDGGTGAFFIAAWHNHKVLYCTASTEEIRVLAGAQKPGGSGDGGPSEAALLNFPASLVQQSDGSLLVSDERNNRIRRISRDPSGAISTVAGVLAGQGSDGDGVPATLARLALTTALEVSGADNPPPGGGLALDGAGALYVTDTFHHCVRRVRPGADGVIGTGDTGEEIMETVAGVCGAIGGYSGDGAAATSAELNRPFDVEIGPDGALYIADTGNHRVRRVDLESGTIATIAGTGQPGFSGERSPAIEAKLREPYGVAFDPRGDLLIVDTLNNRVRQVIR